MTAESENIPEPEPQPLTEDEYLFKEIYHYMIYQREYPALIGQISRDLNQWIHAAVCMVLGIRNSRVNQTKSRHRKRKKTNDCAKKLEVSLVIIYPIIYVVMTLI